MDSARLLTTTGLKMAVMETVLLTAMMRSFQVCACGKIRIITASPKRGSCILCLNSVWNRSHSITENHAAEIDGVTLSGTGSRFTEQTIPTWAVGRMTYSS